MKKLKLRKPNRVIIARVKGENSNGTSVFIKDYTSEGFKYNK